MDKMLRRYPTRQNGLTYWDFQLLRATRLHAPRAARIIGHAMTPLAELKAGTIDHFDQLDVCAATLLAAKTRRSAPS